MVEEVEGIGTENERLPLRNVYALPKRHITIEDSRPMEHVTAEIAVASSTLGGRTTGTNAAEVWVRSAIGSSATRTVEKCILNAELVSAWVDELNVSTYVVRAVIAGPGQGAVASVYDIERQASLERYDRREIEPSEHVPEKSTLIAEKRQFINRGADIAMAHVCVAVASIESRIEGIRIYSQSRTGVDAMRPGVGIGQRQSMGVVLFQAELEAVI
jgi:hypothetical protein